MPVLRSAQASFDGLQNLPGRDGLSAQQAPPPQDALYITQHRTENIG